MRKEQLQVEHIKSDILTWQQNRPKLSITGHISGVLQLQSHWPLYRHECHCAEVPVH